MIRQRRNTDQASIACLRKRRQAIAFDANVQRIFQVNTPYAVACLEEYERLTKQIEKLEQPHATQPSLFNAKETT